MERGQRTISSDPFPLNLQSLLDRLVADYVDDQHQRHKADSQVEGHPRHEVVETGLALEGRAHAAATRHGIALTGQEDQSGENHRYDDSENDGDGVKRLHVS
jgi:hypothetical protein